MTRIKGPVHALSEVAAILADESWRLSSTARKDLVEHFGSWADARKAAAFILKTLTADDYDHSVHLPNPPCDCDVYGLTTSKQNPPPPVDAPWYIKFYLDTDVETHAEVVNVVSLHPDRPPGLRARRKVIYP